MYLEQAARQFKLRGKISAAIKHAAHWTWWFGGRALTS